MKRDSFPLDAWLRSVDEILTERVVVAGQPPHFEEQNHQLELIGKLWGRLDKERDLELHVRAGWLFGTEYIQFLDFQPSTGRYENSILVERRILGRLLKTLLKLHRYSGGTSESFR